MSEIDHLKREHEAALQATSGGPPRPPSNRFFGVGPITDVWLLRNALEAARHQAR